MRVLALVVAFAFASCCACVAQAQTVTPAQTVAPAPLPPPVSIADCRTIDGNATFSLIAPPGTAVLNLSYRNDSLAPLAAVRIALIVDGATIFTYDDVGSFAPGTSVRRRVQLKTDLFPLKAPASCALVSVRYADGRTWTNSSVAPTTEASLEQTPQSRIGVERCQPEVIAATAPRTTTSGKGKDQKTYTSPGTDEATYLNITFVDQAQVAVTGVVFSLLADGKRVERFEKLGTFSPSIPIAASFVADPNIFPLRTLHPQCRVDEVRFADGSTWKNPAVPVEPFGTVQTPGSHVDVLSCSTIPPGRESRFNAMGEVHVEYRNTARVAVTAIDFGIAVNGTIVAATRDVGSFVPDVTIRKSFRLPRTVFPLGTALPACIVKRVEYADGTSWAAPKP